MWHRTRLSLRRLRLPAMVAQQVAVRRLLRWIIPPHLALPALSGCKVSSFHSLRVPYRSGGCPVALLNEYSLRHDNSTTKERKHLPLHCVSAFHQDALVTSTSCSSSFLLSSQSDPSSSPSRSPTVSSSSSDTIIAIITALSSSAGRHASE